MIIFTLFPHQQYRKANELHTTKLQVLWMHKYQIMPVHKTHLDFVSGHQIVFRDYYVPICSITILHKVWVEENWLD